MVSILAASASQNVSVIGDSCLAAGLVAFPGRGIRDWAGGGCKSDLQGPTVPNNVPVSSIYGRLRAPAPFDVDGRIRPVTRCMSYNFV